jgi:hypothetical protein
VLEGQADHPGLRVDELADGGDAVVQLVQHRVDMSLKRHASPGHPQRTARLAQQRGADLALEAGQRPRDARLGDPLELAHLGHRGAVGDLLEPAQCVRIHTHD